MVYDEVRISRAARFLRAVGLRQKPSSQWCSAIGSRSIVNQPAQSTQFLTVSTIGGRALNGDYTFPPFEE